jgi:DNA-binding transcriptional LysR family regulator
MDVNFELYKVFYYVAKYLSFSEAASKLYISQSAVSQSISQLEKKLDSKLLFRSTKQVSLTQEGKILFEHVEQAFNFIKTGERSINEMHSILQGEIRIGASDTICKYYLLPYLKKFNELYPKIKIRVTNRTSPRCVELLNKGSIDFAVINIPIKNEYTNMEIQTVQTIKDVFIGGSNFEHLKNRKISLAELKEYPIIVLEKNTTTRQYFDDFLNINNVDIIPEIELGSIELIVELAKIGLGISYVMENYIQHELTKGSIFVLDLKEDTPVRNLGIITHKSIPIPAAAQKFIELLQKTEPL